MYFRLLSNALPWFATALLALTPTIMVFSRNAAQITVPVAIAACAFGCIMYEGRAKFFLSLVQACKSTNACWLAAALALYALVSLGWTPAPERGGRAIVQTVSIAVFLVLGIVAFRKQTLAKATLESVILGGVAFASTVLWLELTRTLPIREWVGASFQVHRLNRTAVIIALFLPIVGYISCQSRILMRAVGVFVIILGVFSIFESDSESAKLAVCISVCALVFILLTWTINGWRILGSGIVAATLTMPLAVIFAAQSINSDMLEALGLPNQFVRLQIWEAFSHRVLENPIFGHGIQASFNAQSFYTGSNPDILYGLSFVHPHNIALQIWFELGLIGVTLTCGLLTLLFHKMAGVRSLAAASGMVYASTVFTIAIVSHGAWQAWWWAAVGVIPILFAALDQSYASLAVKK